MATSTVLLSLNSEANADQVIMCLKDGMRSNRHIRELKTIFVDLKPENDVYWLKA